VDQAVALNTMLYVLFAACRMLAPLTPFLAESLYQLLKPLLPTDMQQDSVHYLMLPRKDETRLNADVERSVNRMIAVIELVRVMRDRNNYPMKKPIKEVVVIHSNAQYVADITGLVPYIASEINALNVSVTTEEGGYVVRKLEANMGVLGKRLKKEASAINKALKEFTPEQVTAFLATGSGTVLGQTVTMEDVKVSHTFREGIERYVTNTDNDVLVLMTTEMDDAMVDVWRAREFVSAVQKLRKKAGLVITDRMQVVGHSDSEELAQSLSRASASVDATVPHGSWSVSKEAQTVEGALITEEVEISGLALKLQLVRL